MPSIRAAVLAAATAFVAVTSVPARAEEPLLADVLAKSAAYVRTFVSRFSNIVAEERHTQKQLSPGQKSRVMVSDYCLISIPGSTDWIEVLDVIEVDGKPVGDRESRMLSFVKDGAPSTWHARALAVGRASARFNLQDIGTINRPLIAVTFLQTQIQDRFTFSLGPIDKKVAPDARLLQFREAKSPAMFQVGPVYGRIWVNDAGVVLKTEVLFGNNQTATNHVVTTFTPDAALGIYVPMDMQDSYAFALQSQSVEVTGHATYGRFRSFGVKSEESFR